MRALALLVLVTGVLTGGVTRAAPAPTVAVMPFKDLSGQPGRPGAIGEAIRETVTTDLKDVPGLRVIERSNIDRILAEQNLQANKSDLDPLSTVKVGRLLGATLIVAGAYQKAASTVRLTARFVNVETGEVVGTAKVDGPNAEFLSLQDQVTVQLLKSAGIADRHVQTFARRARPKIKSLKTVELYGDSVLATDDKQKADYLKLALDEDPGFSYALKDLDALEKRLKKYEANAQVAQEKSFQELRAKLARETDPDARAQLQLQVLNGLQASRRYRTLAKEARAILDESGHPVGKAGPPGKAPVIRVDELAGFYLVLAENMLKERDPLLRDGEAFLKRFPSSLYFKSVEGLMQNAITLRRKEEDGKARAAEDLAKLASQQRWDLCHVARIFKSHQQSREAQRLFRACLEVGTHPRGEVLRELVLADIEIADWARARADLALLDKEGDKDAASYHQAMELSIPSDG